MTKTVWRLSGARAQCLHSGRRRQCDRDSLRRRGGVLGLLTILLETTIHLSELRRTTSRPRQASNASDGWLRLRRKARQMQDGCVRTKRNRVRLHVCWRTAASEHGRSYAITLHHTTNVSATQELRATGCFGLFGSSSFSGSSGLSGSTRIQVLH